MSVRIVVLSEDKQTECFIRRFFKARNVHRTAFRFETSPRGKQSGEQWVRESFPTELKAQRSRHQTPRPILIVATDADTRTRNNRLDELLEECIKQNIPPPTSQDRVLFVIPKRNIETWLAYLRNEEVNQEDVYSKYKYESDCQREVDRLDDMCRQQKLAGNPPLSLQDVCLDFDKIDWT